MKTDEMLESLKNAKCSWQGCKRKQGMVCSLPLVKQLEDGSLEPSESLMQGIPFCTYHSLLAMQFCSITDTLDGQGQQLLCPFDPVKVAEAVVLSMIMDGQIEKATKSCEEAEAVAKEMRKKLNVKPEDG
jgi:hypothetical protein